MRAQARQRMLFSGIKVNSPPIFGGGFCSAIAMGGLGFGLSIIRAFPRGLGFLMLLVFLWLCRSCCCIFCIPMHDHNESLLRLPFGVCRLWIIFTIASVLPYWSLPRFLIVMPFFINFAKKRLARLPWGCLISGASMHIRRMCLPSAVMMESPSCAPGFVP